MKLNRPHFNRIISRSLIILLTVCLTIPAWANITSIKTPQPSVNHAATAQQPVPPTLVPPPPKLNAHGYVLMDADSGKILAQKNMNQRMAPASLTKLMTLYITFQALANGQIHLNDKIRISKKAWQTGGSRMFVKVGSHVPLRLLINGVIVASGNDACVAISQYIGGTQATFAALMNQTAKKLGMKNTHYVDATGLPRPGHYSTPHDIAILARAIIRDFPQYYYFFNQKWIKYNNIRQANRNRLLWRDTSVDGLKTGHTNAAGFCLVSSAKRHGMRLIAVVMGTPTDSARANESQALLNYGFRFYKTYRLFKSNQVISTQRIWLAQNKYMNFGLINPLYITIPVGQYKYLHASLILNQEMKAPIVKGNVYGHLQIKLNGKITETLPVVALASDPKGGFWRRMTDHVSLFFKNLFG